MALSVLPWRLGQRAELYHQLGQLVGAGIVLPRALEQLRRNPPAKSYERPLATVITQLNEGSTFAEALVCAGKWMPSFDLALLQAGEQSGRLDACFRLLAEYYRERAVVARQMIADLLYPVFLLHFAVLIFSFVAFVGSGNWQSFGLQVLLLLAPLYLFVVVVIYATQSSRNESWRAMMERLLGLVPVLGAGRRSMALSRLAACLEALLNAGVNIIDAWEMAGSASGSPFLRRTITRWRPDIEAGVTPAEVVKGSRAFPQLFEDEYATGEITRSLDQT